jgi:hypothetical protein
MQWRILMTILNNKTIPASVAADKNQPKFQLTVVLVVLLMVTMLSLISGGLVVHCVSGTFMLICCSVHLVFHRRWIKALILETPHKITPALHRQRGLFWGMLLSGFLCGLTGLVSLSLHFCVIPIHVLSGLIFFGLTIYHLMQHRNWLRKKYPIFP